MEGRHVDDHVQSAFPRVARLVVVTGWYAAALRTTACGFSGRVSRAPRIARQATSSRRRGMPREPTRLHPARAVRARTRPLTPCAF